MTTRRASKALPNPYLTTDSPDELDPASRIAHDIVTHRRDVLPSVERIMNAGLDGDATVRALTLFREPWRPPATRTAIHGWPSPTAASALISGAA